MIFLEQNKDDYNNDFRATIQAFFPGEKVVTTYNEECFLHVKVTYHEEQMVFELKDDQGYEDALTLEGKDLTDKKKSRNQVKERIYHLFTAYTKKELPWGDLTGVRPTKIATALLEEGKTEEEIKEHYLKTYFTIEQKADICIEVAKNEHALFEGIDFKNSYCLYVGIPFCPSTCLYCSFTSYPIYQYKDKVDAYLDALEKEMAYAGEAYKEKELIAVYIGGGTPSSISAEQLSRLIKMVHQYFDTSKIREFTVEAGRPDSITREKLVAIKEGKVDRISINPQTMNDETLKVIGRAHNVDQVREAYRMAREVGFTNINMDMIAGLPGETIVELKKTLEEIVRMAPESITVHSLAIKRAANLNIKMNEYKSMIKGSTNEMLLMVDEYVKGIKRYPYYLYRQKNIPGNLENVGYAAEGKESLYNILIMEEKMDIVALGAGASSKLVFQDENRVERVENVKNVDEYMSRVDEMIERKKKNFVS